MYVACNELVMFSLENLEGVIKAVRCRWVHVRLPLRDALCPTVLECDNNLCPSSWYLGVKSVSALIGFIVVLRSVDKLKVLKFIRSLKMHLH